MRCSQWPVCDAESPSVRHKLVDIVISEYCPSTETLSALLRWLGVGIVSTLLTCQVVSDGLYNLFNPRSQTWRNLFPKPSTGLEKTCLSYHVIIIQSGITSLHFQRSYPRIGEQSPWTEWATRGSSQGRPGGFTEWTLSQIWVGEDYDALKMTITTTTLMMKMF